MSGSYYAPWLHTQRAGGISRFRLYDAVGTARHLVDASAAITDSYTLDAFGRQLSASGTTQNAYRFGAAWGYLTDPSGLLQLGHRVYWPEPGRFVQQDPVGEGMNWYVYVGNNPVICIDPWGLKPYVTLTLAGGGGGGFIGLEGGLIFALDPACRQVHVYRYAGGGVGFAFGGALTAQVGALDMDDPQALAGLGLSVSGFAAAGWGLSGQVTGPGQSSPGNYAFGAGLGVAAGAGGGITAMPTYTWYTGTWGLNSLPSALSSNLEPYLPHMLAAGGV